MLRAIRAVEWVLWLIFGVLVVIAVVMVEERYDKENRKVLDAIRAAKDN